LGKTDYYIGDATTNEKYGDLRFKTLKAPLQSIIKTGLIFLRAFILYAIDWKLK
jgi:hypothetical protein